MSVSTSPSKQLPNDDVSWFAGLAMQAIIAHHNSVPDTDSEREEIALWAYRMGQAMVRTQQQLGLHSTSGRAN